jgi:hypothetical protein
VHKKQWKPEALVPICSTHLMELTIEKNCQVGEFCRRQNLSRDEHKYMFVERTQFPQDERRNDVILMDKVI